MFLAPLRTRLRSERAGQGLFTRSGLIAITLIFTVSCIAAGGDGPSITRVEEDWVIEINVPDTEGHTPQIINTMSLGGSLDGTHALFEMNHATMPSYTPGGMQLQLWRGDDFVEYQSPAQNALLSLDDEVIRYTLAMRVNDGRVEYQVKNGTSSTWGSFGSLQVSRPTWSSTIWGYDPAVSVANSRVAYASHRVKRFVLKEVRYYSASGLVSTDSTERVVHEHESEG